MISLSVVVGASFAVSCRLKCPLLALAFVDLDTLQFSTDALFRRVDE